MIRPERLTIKAQEALRDAGELARSRGNPVVNDAHLLAALLNQDEGVVQPLLQKAGLNVTAVRQEVEREIARFPSQAGGAAEPSLSRELQRVFDRADAEAKKLDDAFISTEHLLLAMADEKGTTARAVLSAQNVSVDDLRRALQEVRGSHRVTDQSPEEKYQALERYTRNLTEEARKGKLDPVIGRDEEIRRVMQVLSRRTKNNPVLIGEPGVGKTAIVEGLAQRIVHGDVPSFLENKRILSLDLSLIVAGTKYRGQFEERLKQIMRELIENPHYIVFIDELHTLVGAGSAEGSLDAANILKPALSRGEIQCIGATTPAEYRKSIEKDRSLERRFQAVKVGAPSENEAIRILQGVKPRYEKFHMVNYTDEAIEAAVYLSNRYIPDRFLPDKAIDLLDEAGARVKLRQATLPSEMTDIQRRIKFIVARMESAISSKDFEKAEHYKNQEQLERENLRNVREKFNISETTSMGVVTKADIEDVVSRWTGVPVNSIKEEEMQRLSRIEEELHRRIVSQDTAINALARAIRRSRAGLKSPNRPAGSFLFLGPTGVGKTEMARSLAQFLFGSEKALIRFDMSEFMEKHSVSKLIGSPPGYVGYEEGGQLTERVKRSPYSVVLLDEIEKAHPDVYNILLQVFEDGQLTDGLGNTVDYKNTIIIMTSNIGAKHLQKRQGLGFQSEKEDMVMDKMEELVRGEVKRTFNPEFLNRLDEIIIFNALSETDLIQILELMVTQLNTNLAQKSITIAVADEAKRWILNQTLTDRSYGARPLRRALQKYIEDPLSEALIQGTITTRPAFIEVFLEDNKLFYRPVDSEKAEGVLLYEN